MFRKPLVGAHTETINRSSQRKLRTTLAAALRVTEEDLAALIPPKTDITEVKVAERHYVYVVDDVPLFIFADLKDQPMYLPTLYALYKWRGATPLVPSLLINPNTLVYLARGADLMLPGVLRPEDDPRVQPYAPFLTGSVWAVSVLPADPTSDDAPVPVAVGEMLICNTDLEHSGWKGRGLRVVHFMDDALWQMGPRRYPTRMQRVLGAAPVKRAKAAEGEAAAEAPVAPEASQAPPAGAAAATAVAEPAVDAGGAAPVTGSVTAQMAALSVAPATPAADEAAGEPQEPRDEEEEEEEKPERKKTPKKKVETEAAKDDETEHKEAPKEEVRGKEEESEEESEESEEGEGGGAAAAEGGEEAGGVDEGAAEQEAKEPAKHTSKKHASHKASEEAAAPAAAGVGEEAAPVRRKGGKKDKDGAGDALDMAVRLCALKAVHDIPDSALPVAATAFNSQFLLKHLREGAAGSGGEDGAPAGEELDLRKARRYRNLGGLLTSLAKDDEVIKLGGIGGGKNKAASARILSVDRAKLAAALGLEPASAAAPDGGAGAGDSAGAASKKEHVVELLVVELFRASTVTQPLLDAVGFATPLVERVVHEGAVTMRVPAGLMTKTESLRALKEYVTKKGLVSAERGGPVQLSDEALVHACYQHQKKSRVPQQAILRDLSLLWLDALQPFYAIVEPKALQEESEKEGEVEDEAEAEADAEADAAAACAPTVLPGRIQPVAVASMRRAGRKFTTTVTNLELWGIDPAAFAAEAQRAFSCAATLEEVPGTDRKEARVQGNFAREFVMLLSSHYHVPRRYLAVDSGASKGELMAPH